MESACHSISFRASANNCWITNVLNYLTFAKRWISQRTHALEVARKLVQIGSCLSPNEKMGMFMKTVFRDYSSYGVLRCAREVIDRGFPPLAITLSLRVQVHRFRIRQVPLLASQTPISLRHFCFKPGAILEVMHCSLLLSGLEMVHTVRQEVFRHAFQRNEE